MPLGRAAGPSHHGLQTCRCASARCSTLPSSCWAFMCNYIEAGNRVWGPGDCKGLGLCGSGSSCCGRDCRGLRLSELQASRSLLSAVSGHSLSLCGILELQHLYSLLFVSDSGLKRRGRSLSTGESWNVDTGVWECGRDRIIRSKDSACDRAIALRRAPEKPDRKPNAIDPKPLGPNPTTPPKPKNALRPH